jgi:hypothetical protein
MCIYGKHSIYRFWYNLKFHLSPGDSWNVFPANKGNYRASIVKNIVGELLVVLAKLAFNMEILYRRCLGQKSHALGMALFITGIILNGV